jgi:hypothetical protein
MMFIDGPSPLAPAEVWQAYLDRLGKLNPHDRTVVREKAHAKRILALLAEDADLGEHPPFPVDS